MAEFQDNLRPMDSAGMQIARVTDRMAQGKFLRIQNARQYIDGAWQSRPGLAALATAITGAIHSIKQLNSDIPAAPQSRALIVGAGSKLFSSNASFGTLTERASGFSGSPLSYVPHRPEQSPESWLYVGDANKMVKVRIDGTTYRMGILPPTKPPSATIGANVQKAVDDFDSLTGWAADGTVITALGGGNLVDRVNTTITRLKYEAGTTGWATVEPAALTDELQAGMLLTINSGGGTSEVVRVAKVFPSVTSTTIASIAYDTGTTGAATISLTTAGLALQRDALLRLDAGGAKDELLLIQSVTQGLDGLLSVRVTTTLNHATTETVDAPKSFRAYFSNNHAATETLTAKKFTLNAGAGIGNITKASAVLDLSTSSARPVQADDEIHISLRVSDLSLLREIRLFLDVDGATNDFAHNAYYYAIQPNQLAQALANQTVLPTGGNAPYQFTAEQHSEYSSYVQSQFRGGGDGYGGGGYGGGGYGGGGYGGGGGYQTIWEYFNINPDPNLNPPPGQTVTGANQWTELVIKVRELQRIGSDASRTLRNVQALRVQTNVTASVTIDIDSWWIGGTYGPDVGSFENPYIYVYCGRNSLTGAVSNPSPPIRVGVLPHRQQVIGAMAQHPDPQVDVLDIYRKGGASTVWRYVKTVPNAASPTFMDELPDDALNLAPLLQTDNDCPFTVLDTPRSGVCNIVGTRVTWVSGDNFNTAWGRGALIRIDGKEYSLYTNPDTPTTLELNENAGSLTNVSFELPDAPLLGQPMPVLFGPLGGGSFGEVMFALGSPYQPGVLYITKGNNPDAHGLSLEITNGSESLINGCIYDGRAFVWTNDAIYVVEPVSFGADWRARPIAQTQGLYARWGVCVGDYIYYIGRDGIYALDGGMPRCITDDDLFNLFIHESIAGTYDVADGYGIDAVDWLSLTGQRLFWHNGFVYFIYKRAGAASSRCLIYDAKRQRWMRDIYAKEVKVIYGSEGANQFNLFAGGDEGVIYRFDGSLQQDGGASYSTSILTGFDPQGDLRAEKVYGDVFLDWGSRSGASALSVKLYLNNNADSAVETYSLTTADRRRQDQLDINNGNGRRARSLAHEFVWENSAVRVFAASSSFVPKPPLTKRRATDYDDFGYQGNKFIRAIEIELNSFGVSKTFKIEADGVLLSELYTLNTAAQSRLSCPVQTPFLARLVRLVPQDDVAWELFGWTAQYDRRGNALVVPSGGRGIVTDWLNGGYPGAKWLQGIRLTGDTFGRDVQVDIEYDGGTVGATITVNHSGEVTKPYSFPPFIGHDFRLVPKGDFRFKPDGIELVFEPEPELTQHWETQWTTLEMPGYFHFREFYLCYLADAAVSFRLELDGQVWTHTLPVTGGRRVKTRLDAPPMKGKLAQFRLTSGLPGFRLYQKACEVRAKSWGAGGGYGSFNPFGDVHNTNGARI